MGNYSELLAQDPEAIRQIIELNLIALIDLTQKAIKHMKTRGAGQILQISSVLGFIGLRDSAVYVASKHAVNGLVKSLRYELWGTGVRVWAACPGRTESEFRQVALGEQGRRAVSETSHGEPTEKIARAIVRGIDRPVDIPDAELASLDDRRRSHTGCPVRSMLSWPAGDPARTRTLRPPESRGGQKPPARDDDGGVTEAQVHAVVAASSMAGSVLTPDFTSTPGRSAP